MILPSKRVFWLLTLAAFLLNSLTIVPAKAEVSLPAKPIAVKATLNSPMLKGLKVHTDNPFKFEFVMDANVMQKGAGPFNAFGDLSPSKVRSEANKLIKYFLASLTIPEKDLWVNLSPYEKNRIIPEAFGQTEMGRDLLAQDYILKQITASLMNPDGEVGKEFWKQVYAEAAKGGISHIPVNTFNKVWIVPEKAVVYENMKSGTAYVVESKLKVLTEEDYVALNKSTERATLPKTSTEIQQNLHSEKLTEVSSQIIHDLIIPQLTKEINEGQHFAQLRQVYNSLILATWYKKKLKNSILNQVYNDKRKIQGLAWSNQESVTSFKGKGTNQQGHNSGNVLLETGNLTPEQIYKKYLTAFKKGAYNLIKEEQDPITKQVIQRKYFSGGFVGQNIDAAMSIVTDKDILPQQPEGQVICDVDLAMAQISVSRFHRIAQFHRYEDIVLNSHSIPVEHAQNGMYYIVGPLNFRTISRYKSAFSLNVDFIRRETEKYKAEIASDLDYGDLPKVLYFMGNNEIPREPLNMYTSHIIGAMAAYPDAVKGATVFDIGSGSGTLALAALALGAKDVVLLEHDQGELGLAKAILESNGYKEGEDFHLVLGDLNDSTIKEKLKAFKSRYKNMAVVNMGPWDFYKSANKQGIDLALDLDVDMIFNGGYMDGENLVKNYPKHDTEFEEVKGVLKLKGFTAVASHWRYSKLLIADKAMNAVQNNIYQKPSQYQAQEAHAYNLNLTMTPDERNTQLSKEMQDVFNADYNPAHRQLTFEVTGDTHDAFMLRIFEGTQKLYNLEVDLDELGPRKLLIMYENRDALDLDSYDMTRIILLAISTVYGDFTQFGLALSNDGMAFFEGFVNAYGISSVNKRGQIFLAHSLGEEFWNRLRTTVISRKQFDEDHAILSTASIVHEFQRGLEDRDHAIELEGDKADDIKRMPVSFTSKIKTQIAQEYVMTVAVYPVSLSENNPEELVNAGFQELEVIRRREPTKDKFVPPQGSIGHIKLIFNVNGQREPILIIEENQSSYGFYGIRGRSNKRRYAQWIYQVHTILLDLAKELGIKHIYAIPLLSIAEVYSDYYPLQGQVSRISSANLDLHYRKPYEEQGRWVMSTIPINLYDIGVEQSGLTPVWEYQGLQDDDKAQITGFQQITNYMVGQLQQQDLRITLADGRILPVKLKVPMPFSYEGKDRIDFEFYVYPDYEQISRSQFPGIDVIEGREPDYMGTAPKATIGQIKVIVRLNQFNEPVFIFEENQSSYGLYGVGAAEFKNYADWVYQVHQVVIPLIYEAGFKEIYAIKAETIDQFYNTTEDGKKKIDSKNLNRHYIMPYRQGWKDSAIPEDMYRLYLGAWRPTKILKVWEHIPDNSHLEFNDAQRQSLRNQFMALIKPVSADPDLLGNVIKDVEVTYASTVANERADFQLNMTLSTQGEPMFFSVEANTKTGQITHFAIAGNDALRSRYSMRLFGALYLWLHRYFIKKGVDIKTLRLIRNKNRRDPDLLLERIRRKWIIGDISLDNLRERRMQADIMTYIIDVTKFNERLIEDYINSVFDDSIVQPKANPAQTSPRPSIFRRVASTIIRSMPTFSLDPRDRLTEVERNFLGIFDGLEIKGKGNRLDYSLFYEPFKSIYSGKTWFTVAFKDADNPNQYHYAGHFSIAPVDSNYVNADGKISLRMNDWILYPDHRNQGIFQAVLKRIPAGAMLVAEDVGKNESVFRRIFAQLGFIDIKSEQVQSPSNGAVINMIAVKGNDSFNRAQLAEKRSDNTGGIDLTSSGMGKAMQVKAGEDIKFHIDPAQMAQWQQAPGVTFTIRSITPLENLGQFLGVNNP